MPAAIRPLASAVTSAANGRRRDVGPAVPERTANATSSGLGARPPSAGRRRGCPASSQAADERRGLLVHGSAPCGRGRMADTSDAQDRHGAGSLRAMADRTQSSVEIAAEPGAVLDVIADFERYPEWAHEVKLGRRCSARTATAGPTGSSSPWTRARSRTTTSSTTTGTSPRTAPAACRGTWCGPPAQGPGRLLHPRPHSRRLAPTVTYDLEVDLTIPMLGMLKRKAEKLIIDPALTELKKRVEG